MLKFQLKDIYMRMKSVMKMYGNSLRTHTWCSTTLFSAQWKIVFFINVQRKNINSDWIVSKCSFTEKKENRSYFSPSQMPTVVIEDTKIKQKNRKLISRFPPFFNMLHFGLFHTFIIFIRPKFSTHWFMLWDSHIPSFYFA